MKIETLKLFCDVVRHSSFSRAAALNGVSQSAVTQSIHQLERAMGAQLVDRSRRPFLLTAAGQLCHDGFQQIVEQYEAVSSSIQAMDQEVSGQVRVAAIYSVGLYGTSQCVQDFMSRYPKAVVRLMFLQPRRVYEAVVAGEVDLGILAYPQSDRMVKAVPLRAAPLILVCPPNHPLTRQRIVTAAQLCEHAFVAFDPDLQVRQDVDRRLRSQGVSLNVAMEFDNIETIKQAVTVGAGISLLPAPTVQGELKAGTLATVPLAIQGLVRPIGIIHRRRKIFTPPMTRFIEQLQIALGDGPAPGHGAG